VQVLPEVTSTGPGGPVLTPRLTPVGPSASTLGVSAARFTTHTSSTTVRLSAESGYRFVFSIDHFLINTA
jgi:hypothetical protein